MARYILGQCLILIDNNETIFCEILGYKGSGNYCVSLTRGIVIDRFPNKFSPISTLHEAVIEELMIDPEEL